MIRIRSKKYNRIACLLLLIMVIGIVGCGVSNEPEEEKKIETGFIMHEPGTYDSVDSSAILISIDKSNKSCTFYNRSVDKNYTLSYDGTSKLYDKYGSSIVIDQLNPGDVVDLTFVKSKKLINSLTKSSDVWVYEKVTDFDVDALSGRIKINGGDYKFNDKTKIFSEEGVAQLIDINGCDELIFSGKEHTIYSIVIDQGHGYLRLKGQDYFEGGWIEVGSKIIKTVSEDMLIAVPVGNYDVKLSNGEYEGTKTVSIKKNSETVLDVSDLVTIEEDQESTLVLVVEPAGAAVYLDGKEVDISKPINVEYGVHQLIAKAEGYNTLTQYIKVGQENATLEITMEKAKNQTEIDAHSARVSPSPAAEVTTYVTQVVEANNTSNYKVKIDSPEETEVYLDGAYIGTTPVEFAKTEGTRVVTLRKEGFVTRSYTISLDGTLQDETFSFSTLVKEE